MKKEVIDRLITYAQVDTQSDENSNTCPSTPGQLTLGQLLVDELKEIGMQDVTMDENGYVMATLPANSDKPIPTIGFLAHIDTATDFTGLRKIPRGEHHILCSVQNDVLSVILFDNLRLDTGGLNTRIRWTGGRWESCSTKALMRQRRL